MAILTGVRQYLIEVFIYISLIFSYEEHFFVFLLAIYMSSLGKCLFRFSAYFLIELFVIDFRSCLYILDLKPSHLYHLKIFSVCKLSFCFQFLCCAKAYKFVVVWLLGWVRLTWPHVARHTPLSMVFLRQESWSGMSFPSPGNLPNPRTELTSPAHLFSFAFISILLWDTDLRKHWCDLCWREILLMFFSRSVYSVLAYI